MKRLLKWKTELILIVGMALCLGVFCWAASQYFGQQIAYRQAETAYAALSVYGPESAGTRTETAEYESPVDFEALRAINPEIVAWIEIPGTAISYPVAQAADNQYYLGRTFSGGKNNSGAIFLDYASASDLRGQHSVFYGHNMKNGSMFASLLKYKDAGFFSEHPEILLYTPEETIRLRVISAYAARAESSMRQTAFEKEELTAYIKRALSLCSFSAKIDASGIDRLYTFATCSYEWNDTRTWVHAVQWFDDPASP